MFATLECFTIFFTPVEANYVVFNGELVVNVTTLCQMGCIKASQQVVCRSDGLIIHYLEVVCALRTIESNGSTCGDNTIKVFKIDYIIVVNCNYNLSGNAFRNLKCLVAVIQCCIFSSIDGNGNSLFLHFVCKSYICY